MFIDYKAIENFCISKAFDIKGIHGIQHWISVRNYGLKIANTNRANKEIIQLFAWFHDIGRVANKGDYQHGSRSVEIMDSIYKKLFYIGADEYEVLRFAIKYHTDTIHYSNITVGTCWDADRLDLCRIGRIIDPSLLNSEEAKRLAVQINKITEEI
jgi:uncharacterized protein